MDLNHVSKSIKKKLDRFNRLFLNKFSKQTESKKASSKDSKDETSLRLSDLDPSLKQDQQSSLKKQKSADKKKLNTTDDSKGLKNSDEQKISGVLALKERLTDVVKPFLKKEKAKEGEKKFKDRLKDGEPSKLFSFLPQLVKPKKYNIGIQLRNYEIHLEKAYENNVTEHKTAYFSYDLEKNEEGHTQSLIEGLDQFLSKFDFDFFEESSIKVCLPFQDISLQNTYVPVMSKREVEKGLAFQVKEDELWDYINYGEVEKNGRKFYDINLVKVKYSVLKSYMDIFSKYNLELSLITAEPFVLPELLSTGLIEDLSNPFILADLKRKSLKIDIIIGMQVVYSRHVPLGYWDILCAFSGVEKRDATDANVADMKTLLHDYDVFDDSQVFSKEYDRPLLRSRAQFVLDKLILEIQKTEGYFLKSKQNTALTHLFMTGSFLSIKGIASIFSNTLDFEVDHLHYKKKCMPTIDSNYCEEEYENIGWCLATCNAKSRKRGNFLPKNYLGQQLVKPLVFSMLGLNLLAFILVAGISGFLVLRNLPLEGTLQDQQAELQLLRRSVQIKRVKKVSSGSELQIKGILEKGIPVTKMMQYFSFLKMKHIQLNKLVLSKNILEIQGQIESGKSLTGLMDFISEINKVPFLSNVRYSIQGGSPGMDDAEESEASSGNDGDFQILCDINAREMSRYNVDGSLWDTLLAKQRSLGVQKSLVVQDNQHVKKEDVAKTDHHTIKNSLDQKQVVQDQHANETLTIAKKQEINKNSIQQFNVASVDHQLLDVFKETTKSETKQDQTLIFSMIQDELFVSSTHFDENHFKKQLSVPLLQAKTNHVTLRSYFLDKTQLSDSLFRYDPWLDSHDHFVLYHPQKSIVSEASIQLHGKLREPKKGLFVNGELVLSDRDGFFTLQGFLKEGKNTLVLSSDQQKEHLYVWYYPKMPSHQLGEMGALFHELFALEMIPAQNPIQLHDVLTRASFANLLVGLVDVEAAQNKQVAFRDVSHKHPFYESIQKLATLGILKGDHTGHFYPNQPITKLEAVIAIMRASFKPTKLSSLRHPFVDLDAYPWSQKSIAQAYSENLLSNQPYFKPDEIFRVYDCLALLSKTKAFQKTRTAKLDF